MQKNIGCVILEDTTVSMPEIINNERDYVRFNTTLQSYDTKNRNNRIYKGDFLKESLSTDNLKEKIRTKNFVGEAGHPLSDDVKRQSRIISDNISHVITEISFDDNKSLVNGVVETYSGFKGPDMMGAIKQGVEVAFSLRAIGNAVKDSSGTAIINGPILVISYDWVLFPSHKEAYMMTNNGINSNNQINFITTPKSNPITNNIVKEDGQLLEFDISEMVNFLNKSDNMQCFSESMNIPINESTIKLIDSHEAYLRSDNEVVKVFLEESLKSDIDRYLLNFNKL